MSGAGQRARRTRGARVLSFLIVTMVGSTLLSSCGGDGENGEGGSDTTLERVRSTDILKFGTDATYPPFGSVDPETGELAGLDIDLARAVASRLGARAEFVVVPFDGIIAGLRSGKYDVVVSAMTITPERAKRIRFTDPYTVAGQTVAVRAEETSIAGPADLPGKRIGVQLGTTGEIEARRIPGAEVVSFDAIGSAFRDLENGNLDAVIADVPTARLFVREHETIRLSGEPLTREEFGMAVRLQDGDLLRELNKALTELRDSGELSRMERTWGAGAAPAKVE